MYVLLHTFGNNVEFITSLIPDVFSLESIVGCLIYLVKPLPSSFLL